MENIEFTSITKTINSMFFKGLILGLIIGSLALGWGMEYRMSNRFITFAEKNYISLQEQMLLVSSAFQVVEPDPIKRAAAGNMALRELNRQQVLRASPSSSSDVPKK